MARDLREFINLVEQRGQLRRITAPVDPELEIAEISNRMLQCGGPALLFENVKGSPHPVAVNLLGTVERTCWSMGMEHPQELETLGKKLGMLQQPKPPKKISQALEFGKVLFDVVNAKPQRALLPPCHPVVLKGDDVDLTQIPMIQPYPQDGGKVVTLGLVITKDCETGIPNVGVYRLQLQGKNTRTVQWLSVRGGARHLRKAAENGKKLEIAIAIGVHPLIIMAAATPIPVDLSEWLFAGLYGGSGVHLAKCKTLDLEVPAALEFVLEGTITPGEVATDGPFGDHMGYYGPLNDSAPLVRFQCVTHRKNPIYLTTFSGRPPKEEAMIAIALHTVGALGKLFSEVSENADLKPVEGLQSVGASWLQRMLLGVLPQVAPNYLSYALLRFEINIRASAILGFVGAGGIGYELRNAMSWGQGRFDEAAAVFILLFLTIVVVDQTSGHLRDRLARG